MPGATGPITGSAGKVLSAAMAYWAAIFAAGFVFGAIRVVVLAPKLGETAAVAVEIPVMLAISWVTARHLTRRFKVPARPGPRLLMGWAALALLIVAEIVVAVAAFGNTFASWAASLGTTPGLLGLLGQIAFAMIPLFQAMTSRAS